MDSSVKPLNIMWMRLKNSTVGAARGGSLRQVSRALSDPGKEPGSGLCIQWVLASTQEGMHACKHAHP